MPKPRAMQDTDPVVLGSFTDPAMPSIQLILIRSPNRGNKG
jgi:hypothetical protein